jgi:hypothetical protein
MKVYIVNLFAPDTYEGNETLFGVFDSEKKYQEALQNYFDENGEGMDEDVYEVIEVELNEARF